MQSITNTHISCKYIYLHIHFLEYNNLAHSDKGHRSFCIVFTHTETPSHWKHTALYSMTLLQFSTFPVPIHIPRCWTKSILKTSASYQTYNSHTISQNRFRRNFKWKNHFYTQPSYVCGYNLARNNCYNLKGRKVRFWCLQFSQVFKWEPPLFPVPDTVGLRLRLAPSPSLCLHWKPKPSTSLNTLISNIQLPFQHLSLAFTPTPLLSLTAVTVSDASVHHIVWTNSQLCLDTAMASHPMYELLLILSVLASNVSHSQQFSPLQKLSILTQSPVSVEAPKWQEPWRLDLL